MGNFKRKVPIVIGFLIGLCFASPVNSNENECATPEVRIVEATSQEEECVLETPVPIPCFGYDFIPLSKGVQSQIRDICEEYGTDFALMMGIAEQESRFDVNAYNSDSGDYGLFQINSLTWGETALELGLINYKTDVFQNAEMACYILNDCLYRANGNFRKALNYYRTGTPNNKYEAGSDYATVVLANANNIIGKEKFK